MPDQSLRVRELRSLYSNVVAAAREQRLDDAIRGFRRLLRLAGDEAPDLASDCRANLGACYLAKGMVDEAIVELRRATELSPANLSAGCALAELYDQCGRRAEAIAQFEALLRRAPGHHEARCGLWRCYVGGGEYDNAIGVCRAALQVDPTDPLARADLAIALYLSGRSAEAAAVVDEAGTDLPRDADRLCDLAEIMLAEGRPEDGARLLAMTVELDPAHENGILRLAEARVMLGDYDDAVRLCRTSQRQGAQRIPVLDVLLLACERKGDGDACVEYASELARLAPLDPYAHYRLANAWQRLGNYIEAMQRYALAAELAAADDELRESAYEAMEALDSIQQHQVVALASNDIAFRLALKRDPAEALERHGFRLTEVGMHLLASLEIDDLPGAAGRSDRRTSH